ncbi:DUF4209 domain-containing protein [Parerythrobacter aurantius]|uniref:DUF4209 domain-containing protein n=1 Tax=Parerythrobacter aurantius TaxID=3127706 RepID=UPI00324638AB
MYLEAFTADEIRAVKIDDLIDEKMCVDVEAFDSKLREAANEADKAGDGSRAKVLRLFAAICSFHFKPHDRAEPFSNILSWTDGSRSMIGSDMEQAAIDQLDEIREEIETLSLRTRVSDLVWTRDKRRYQSGIDAINGYVTMLRRLIDGTGSLRFESLGALSVSSQNFLARALVIARALGWERKDNDALKETGRRLVELAIEEGGMTIARFGNLAFEAGLDVRDVLKPLPEKVEAALQREDFSVAEELQKLQIRVETTRSENREVPTKAALKLAEIHETRADKSDAAFLKTHALQEAIDSLHGIRGVKEKRQSLHEKLREAQLHMSDEFTPISHSTDISAEVTRIVGAYDGLDLLDSIRQLAHAELPKDPEHLRENARSEAERFPLSSLFSTAILDNEGRTTARTGGGIESEDTLRHKIIQHQQIHMGLAVAAAISPVRQKIINEFRVDENLLFEICRISPFVPSGAEHIMAKGLQAFLYGDEIVASACLIPYLESGLRAMVVGAGRLDTTISTGGIEQTIGLGPLLSDHRDALERVFGTNIVFAIENLFVHPLGPKIRHNFCHGLSSDSSFYSSSYIYACKLLFSLVVLPLSGAKWEQVKNHLQSRL